MLNLFMSKHLLSSRKLQKLYYFVTFFTVFPEFELNTICTGMKFRKTLVDSLMIIFSVLFALFINEWRGNINEKKRTKVIMENIRLELLENKAVAEEYHKYHEQAEENIDSIFEAGTLDSLYHPDYGFILFKIAPYGVIQKSYQDIAWEVGKQESIATRIEFDQSKILFDVYDQIKTVNETIDRIIEHLSNRDINKKELIRENAILLSSEFHEVSSQEETLYYKVKNALEIWEKGKD